MSGNSANWVAGGTIRPSRFVKVDGDNDHRVLEADANEAVVGISQTGTNRAPLSDLVSTSYAAIVDEQIKVYGESDFAVIEAGDAIVRGNKLKSDADGKGVPILTTGTTLQQYGAIALASAAAAGELIPVMVLIGDTYPALS